MRPDSGGMIAWARERALLLRRAWLNARLDQTNFSSGLGDSAWALYGLVRSIKPQVCVEIGSARGKSACYIGAALRDNGGGTLYAIDPHTATAWNDSQSVETLPIMRANLRRFALLPFVEIVRASSGEAASGWKRPIDLLFIDGDHSYAGVRQDWELFARHVQPLGAVVFHDTLWDIRPELGQRADMGVPQFVDELRTQGYPVLTLAQNFGVSIVQPTCGGVLLRVPA
ncbi:MAG: class I SAM-dependent methyltransferase [Roseiflexaceae bacterium]|nr:class I SAM-dependent methyltransferase [Roseiflexaceae bacterium]